MNDDYKLLPPFDFAAAAEIAQEARSSPLEALMKGRDRFGRAEDGFNMQRYLFLGVCLVIAKEFARHSSDWKQFTQLDFWNRRRIKPASNNPASKMLKFVIEYSFGVTGSKGKYHQTRRYAKVMGFYLDKDLNFRELANELLRDQGIKGAIARMKVQAAGPAAASDTDRASSDDVGAEEEDEDEDEDDDAGSAKPGQKATSETKERIRSLMEEIAAIPKGQVALIVRVLEEDLMRILDGDASALKLSRQDERGSFVVINARPV